MKRVFCFHLRGQNRTFRFHLDVISRLLIVFRHLGINLPNHLNRAALVYFLDSSSVVELQIVFHGQPFDEQTQLPA